MNTELLVEVRMFASNAHQSTNHYYDGHPYDYHLDQVESAARRFKHLIPDGKSDIIFAACRLHDVIEDCRVTYNDLKKVFGYEIAELVYAVTNEKGRERHERANDRYYEGIRKVPGATFVKLCDRIANIEYSKLVQKDSSMLKKYQYEYSHFKQQLYDPFYQEMFLYIELLF